MVGKKDSRCARSLLSQSSDFRESNATQGRATRRIDRRNLSDV